MRKPAEKLSARSGGPQVVKIVLTMQEQLRKIKQVRFAMYEVLESDLVVGPRVEVQAGKSIQMVT